VAVVGSRSKALYKVAIGLIKVSPMTYALLSLVNTTASYFGIDLPILSYVGSVSLLTLLLLYVLSYVFCFCPYHRMFLHYVTVTWALNITDLYVGIPVGDFNYMCLQLGIAGAFLFVILYIYVKSHKRLVVEDSRQH